MDTVVFHWPQIVTIVFSFIALICSLFTAKTTGDFALNLLFNLIGLFVLYQGGYFMGCRP